MYRLSALFILLCLIFANLCAGRARANNSIPLMLDAATDAPKKHALLVGDELDGFDECLIPSDYISKNDGSNNLRDDELGNLLDELKKKRPANVTLSFDSCFSGTITRGGRHKARGQKWGGPQPSMPAPPPKNSVVEKGSGGLLRRGEAVASGYVLITATRNNQVDTETNDENGQEMGPLSYALSRAFSKAGPQTTCRDIFESVNETMNRMGNDQNPQLEGDMDKVLMNGTALPPQPYIPVSVDAKGKITLQAGELQGMTSGSRFALFPNETKDFKSAQQKAEAEIIKLDLTSATLKLIDESIAKGAKPQDLQAARAIETSHQYGDNRLKGEAQMTDGGQFELAEDDYVNIELKNDGEKDAFVTVLDLLNDGTIRPIWPYPGIKVQENRIPADKKWHRLPQSPYTFRIEKPYGKEIYKAIATSEPADFSPLLDLKSLARGDDPRSFRARRGQALFWCARLRRC